jgi:hypothetical protein
MVRRGHKRSDREGALMTVELSESNESKAPGALIRWPRELADLWSGCAPFDAISWPFRDIKVEEFIEVTIW